MGITKKTSAPLNSSDTVSHFFFSFYFLCVTHLPVFFSFFFTQASVWLSACHHRPHLSLPRVTATLKTDRLLFICPLYHLLICFFEDSSSKNTTFGAFHRTTRVFTLGLMVFTGTVWISYTHKLYGVHFYAWCFKNEDLCHTCYHLTFIFFLLVVRYWKLILLLMCLELSPCVCFGSVILGKKIKNHKKGIIIAWYLEKSLFPVWWCHS